MYVNTYTNNIRIRRSHLAQLFSHMLVNVGLLYSYHLENLQATQETQNVLTLHETIGVAQICLIKWHTGIFCEYESLEGLNGEFPFLESSDDCEEDGLASEFAQRQRTNTRIDTILWHTFRVVSFQKPNSLNLMFQACV